MSEFNWAPVLLTLRVSLIATLIAIVLGLLISWLLAKKSFWGKNLLDALLMQPLVLPPTVLGYYLLVVFGRNAPLGRFLEDWFGITLVFTAQGAVLAALITAMPFFIKPARTAMAQVDGRLENAARLLGRSEWSVFRSITLPLAWRGVVAGGMMAFARAVGEFGATLMVAANIPGRTQTVPLAIYDAVLSGDIQQASLLVGMMTLFSVVLMFVVMRITAGRF